MNRRDDDNVGPFPKSVFPPSVFPRRIFPWMGGDDEDDTKSDKNNQHSNREKDKW